MNAFAAAVWRSVQHGHQDAASGFAIDEVIADDGASGVHTRLSERPEGKRLFDKLRKGDMLLVRRVDRLGRNYQDVVDTIRQPPLRRRRRRRRPRSVPASSMPSASQMPPTWEGSHPTPATSS